jgi:arsenate reductase
MSPFLTPSELPPTLSARLSPNTKTRVIFLCSLNSARSQMAEALLRYYGGDRFEAFSAGLQPEAEINPYARRVMEEIGISLHGQYPKHVREYMGRVHFGYCIVVCSMAEENCPTSYPCVGERLYWPFQDPTALIGNEDHTLAKFREVRDQIQNRICRWLTGLVIEGGLTDGERRRYYPNRPVM